MKHGRYNNLFSHRGPLLRVGIIDTGVNPWHSQVRGQVEGCRIYLDAKGTIQEDDDYRDLVGHGTVVAGIIRRTLPEAELFAVKAFDTGLRTYPSLVARALLRAAGHGCSFINVSLGMVKGPGVELLAEACEAVLDAGCVIVAAGKSGAAVVPASLPGVIGVVADDFLVPDEIGFNSRLEYPYSANGRSLSLDGKAPLGELEGNSYACARVTGYLAGRRVKMERRICDNVPCR